MLKSLLAAISGKPKGPSPELLDWLAKPEEWRESRNRALEMAARLKAQGGHMSVGRGNPFDPQLLHEPLRSEVVEYLRTHPE